MTPFQQYLKESLYITEQAGGGEGGIEDDPNYYPGDPPIYIWPEGTPGYPDGHVQVWQDPPGEWIDIEDYNPDGDPEEEPEEEGEDDGDIDNDEDFQRTLWWLQQGGPEGYLDYPGWDQGYYPGQDDKGLPISIPIPIDAPKP